MLGLRRFVLLPVFAAGPLAAQAPPLTELWRVAATTLTTPAALASGPTGTFWNPAALADQAPARTGTFEILEAPDVLSLSGFLAAGQWRLSRRLVIGGMLGRMAVTDLVRTTTSPVALPGDIPVQSQVVGIGAGLDAGSLALGLLARGHDTRLDAIDEGGATLDAGVRWHPVGSVTVAAASQFLSPGLHRNGSAELGVGIEGRVPLGPVSGAPAYAVFSGGAGWHGHERAELEIGAALALSDRLSVAWGLGREQAVDAVAWRHTVGLAFRTSHYAISVARGEGLNGLGATFRLGLTAATRQ